jgi:hypothetical protein
MKEDPLKSIKRKRVDGLISEYVKITVTMEQFGNHAGGYSILGSS